MSRSVTGRRFVLEAIAAGTIRRVHLDQSQKGKLGDIRSAAERAGIEVREVPRRTLDDLAGGVRHQGVVATGPPYPFRSLEKLLDGGGLLVALDEITDPHNAGAIIRSAVAFGARGVLLPKHRAASITPVVVRASAGATEHARIAQVTNLQRALQSASDAGFLIAGLAGDGETMLADLSVSSPLVLVVGSEGKGLRRMVRKRCDHVLRIPMSGPTESLNASVATAIALYELTR
ncbi:MAG: 23S rRNA (guanosine(2251)-2'-O)-methyltransferase RlmB [Myxococcota bacterium]